MQRTWYRMHDAKPNGVIELHPGEAHPWNAKGWGVFWAVNRFRGPRRIENLEQILAWAIDIDQGTKAEQQKRIKQSPLVPSLVVETKNGHHVYWDAKPGATAAKWNAIVLGRLVPFFGADKNARDLARILRIPGFKHMKNPSSPFLVDFFWRHEVSYTEEQMLRLFPAPEKENEDRQKHEASKRECKAAGDSFWERVWSLDCKAGLERLSGHTAVGGEQYSFKRNRTGTWNILVNGKGTSAWVDAQGRIGSLSGGGPSLYAWCRWFGHSPRHCVDTLKQVFPELEDKKG